MIEQDHWEAAEASLRAALETQPDDPALLRDLAAVLRGRGDAKGTLEALWTSLRAAPQDNDTWIALRDALGAAEFEDTGAESGTLGAVLLACLLNDGLDHRRLSRAAYAVLRATPVISQALGTGAVDRAVLDALGEALPLKILRKLVLPFPAWERMVKAVRALLLEQILSDAETSADAPLVSALASQGFLNGYVMSVDFGEAEALDRLRALVTPDEVVSPPSRQRAMAMLAAYVPMSDWVDVEKAVELAQSHPDPAFIELLMQQVEGPATEDEARDSLAVLTELEEGVSLAVRSQYEEHPYPRWLSVDRPTPVHPRQRLAVLFPDHPGQPVLPEGPLEVLIAGCGTGLQVAGFMARYTDVDVLGIDLSRSSLAYATRALGALGFDDVSLAQADILKLRGWKRRFDLIECTGVLHHMADPLEGASVLSELLRPGGVMKLALYSEEARQDVVALRARISIEGFDSTSDSIRTFRSRLLEEERSGASRLKQVFEWPDFYVLEECRDLLFHVHELRFTMDGIQDLIQTLGLDFLGFEVRAETRYAFESRCPEPGASASLEAWKLYEAEDPAAFRGMYQFWVRKPG